MEETIDTWRQSEENLDPKDSSNESEAEADADGVKEEPSFWETEESSKKPKDSPDDDFDLKLDDRTPDESSEATSALKINDRSKPFEDYLEEFDSDESTSDENDQIQYREGYARDAPTCVSREFYDGQQDGAGEEEEIYSTEPSSGAQEKPEERPIPDTAEPSESDVGGLLADIPLEKRQAMTPEDEASAAQLMDDRYMKKLLSYKTTMEELEARRAEFHEELGNMETKLESALEEDSTSFGELLEREKEIGVGLVFEKSGRAISAKAMETTIRRKVLRRQLLNQNRFKYIYYRHVYENVKAKLRSAEKLGAGLTILEYEVLRVDNENYREKVEERDKLLENIALKIETVVATLAHYKEKDVANRGQLYNEHRCLELVRSEALRTRAGFTKVLALLWTIRNDCLEKKRRAGMLFAVPVVRDMEKTMEALDKLKAQLERMISIEESTGGVGTSRNKLQVDENRTTVTGMTRVKSAGRMKTRPGRC
ncbi:coiled-coil domain-containing protein 96-like [Venturia canescens]|uniref:coiled-coil domain-containing protein 96-like n=1 Tax=Venturia canescens TaxID=32260 RepID=UPI001C9BC4BB|nr:coiled-coil domain-containing protein 96-like [Venturia canescens]